MADARTGLPVRLVDGTTPSQEVAINGSGQVAIQAAPANDGVDIGDVDVASHPADTFVVEGGALGKGVLLQGDDGADRTNVLVDTAGHLQVDVLTGGGGTEYTDDTSTHTAATTTGLGIVLVAAPTDTTVDANDLAFPGMSTDRRIWTDTQIVGQDAALDVSGATVTVDLSTNNDVTTELAGSTAVAAMADDDANPTVLPIGAYVMGYDSGNTNWNRVEVDDAGHLQVDVLTGGGADTPSNEALETASASALAAGSNADVRNTTDLGGLTRKLRQIDVGGSVQCKAIIRYVENGTVTATFATIYAPACHSVTWKPPHRNYTSVTFGANAGDDKWEVNVTNLDTNDAADFHVNFHYEA